MLKQNRTGNKSLSGSKFHREIAMTNYSYYLISLTFRVIEASIHGSYSVFPGRRSVFCGVWSAFLCAWVLVIAAYGGNILAPVLTLISLRTLKKLLFP